MTSSREKILNRMKSQRRTASLPESWEPRSGPDDLVSQFLNVLKEVKGEPHLVESLDLGWILLEGILKELGAKSVVMNDEAPLNQLNFAERFPDLSWQIAGEASENILELCRKADVGITGVSAVLAQTGTVVLKSGRNRSRLVSLLPTVHVALAPVSALKPDIITWMDSFSTNLAAQTVLVSGPSKTADIEQTLSVGVHGPKRFIVILYND